MIKISTISFLGFLVMITSLFGIPATWKNIIYILAGLSIFVLSFLIRRELHKVLQVLHGHKPEAVDPTASPKQD